MIIYVSIFIMTPTRTRTKHHDPSIPIWETLVSFSRQVITDLVMKCQSRSRSTPASLTFAMYIRFVILSS